MLDVYDGRVWTTFSDDAGNPFLEQINSLGHMLNVTGSIHLFTRSTQLVLCI